MNRYSRLAAIPSFGEEGVRKLRESRVLVIGCGALGSHCAMGLVASGIGNICIADFDTIDLSNLQRQFFFRESETGQAKADILSTRIRELNSEVEVEVINKLVDTSLARFIFPDFDFIIDGSDNPATKYMTDSICAESGTACCIGGVRDFQGQVMSWQPGTTRYSDIYGPEPPDRPMLPCTAGGVAGPAAAIAASVQCAEAIKRIAGVGNPLYDKLFMFDLLIPETRVLEVG